MRAKPIRGENAVSQAAEDALVKLLAKKGRPFEGISTTELCHDAGISRQTFYRHFSSVDDVLAALARRHARAFAELALDETELLRDYRNRIGFMFEFFASERELLAVLKHNDVLQSFFNAFWGAYDWQWVPAETDLSERQQQRLARFITAAFTAIIEDWVDDAEAPMPQDMGPVMEELMLSVPQLVGPGYDVYKPEALFGADEEPASQQSS